MYDNTINQGTEPDANVKSLSDVKAFLILEKIDKKLSEHNARFDNFDKKFDNINKKLKKHNGQFNEIRQEIQVVRQEIRETEGRLGSRMRELEDNVRDISSIKGAVQRMNVGFQGIPYEMSGRAAVEEIKDHY